MGRTVGSVGKAARVLACFNENGELGITELSGKLGYPKSVVHRIVTTLEQEGFLEQDPDTRKYRVGLALFELGSSYLRHYPGRDIISLVLEEVSRQSGHTCYFGILDGTAIVITHICEGSSPVRIKAFVGERLPVHATAIGKVLLGALSDGEIDDLFKDTALEPVTGATLTDVTLLKKVVREAPAGYATSVEELYPGTASVAAVVRGEKGEIIGAMCVSFPVFANVQDEIRKMGHLLKEKANRLSALPTIEGPLRDRRRRGELRC